MVFLKKKLKSHVTLTMGKKSNVHISDVQPQPIFSSWKIYELDTHKDSSLKLAYLANFTFRVKSKIRRKAGDKSPIVLTFKDLHCYQEVEKRSVYERIGINVSVKQLALARWRETKVPDFSVTFYPGKWDLPEPPLELEKILAAINK